MTFIDIHCHLDRLKKIGKVVEDAGKKDVGVIVTSGIDIESGKKSLEFGNEFNAVKVVLGLHPIDLKNINETKINKVIEFIQKNKNKIIGIGEIGIDLKEENNLNIQKKVFEKMLKLALELDLPVIVHSRKAERECIEILEKHKMERVLMHCFSGRKSLIKQIIENKWFISIPASIKYSEQFQLFAEIVPIENIFCETDSPFLHPDRKMDNTPENVIVGYEKIAEIKKMKLKEVERKIEENFKRLFGECL